MLNEEYEKIKEQADKMMFDHVEKLKESNKRGWEGFSISDRALKIALDALSRIEKGECVSSESVAGEAIERVKEVLDELEG